MNSLPQIQKQVNHLVNYISQCNFISKIDKEDIVQDTLLSIIQKYNEGKLVDDFDLIKNYTFITLRNYCTSYRLKSSRMTYVYEVYDTVDEDTPHLPEETINSMRNQIKFMILKPEFSPKQRTYIELLLKNYKYQKIKDEMGITQDEYRILSTSTKNKLRTRMSKPIKYKVKSINDPKFEYPCHHRKEAIDFLNLKGIKEFNQISNNGLNVGEYYIEKQLNEQR
jgi:RNA polymerase sigma factor (sigma-70 family)